MIPLPAAFLGPPIAHRALHDRARGRPENSRAAFAAAIAAGYGIECDVQLSADCRAMVFHDQNLERLTAESGPLRAYPAGALGRIKLRGCDEGIPTLEEMLVLTGGRTPLLIEIKDQDGAMGPAVGALETAVAAALRGYDGPAAVMSFNPHAVAAFAAAAPRTPRGLTTSAYRARDWPDLPAALRHRLRSIPDYDRVGASFISHEASDLGRPRVAALRAGGAAVLCWTIRSAEAEGAARRLADNVTFEGYAAAIPPP